MALSTQERNQLIRQLYLSEPEYRRAQRKATALQALTSRTPEQETQLADLLAKLQHDRDVIAVWKALLIANGVTWPPAGRALVLDALRDAAAQRRAALAQLVLDKQAALGLISKLVTHEEWERQDAGLRAEIAGHLKDRDDADEDLTVIDGLKAESTVWGA